jgi:hypothetical protein
MSDHGNQAAARHSRREFLRIGTGMAGAVSLGAMLAACGTQPAQPVADSAAVEGGKQAAMALRSYLVIARYNRQKWNTLSAADRKEAEEAAEVLFPEKSTPLTDVKDMPFVRTLYTSIHTRIPYEFRSMSDDKQDELVENIFTEFQAQPTNAPGTDEQDPGIGWIAVINADRFAPFIEYIGGKTGPLWRMYDMEVIPLNNDRTTEDVYELMTPTSWGHSPSR